VKSIIIHSEAIAELKGAIACYEDQKPGLGIDFLTEVERVISKIQQKPNLGKSYKIAGLRQYVLQRFPFLSVKNLSGLLRSPMGNADLTTGKDGS
jgi:toxin ParE1/3/4